MVDTAAPLGNPTRFVAQDGAPPKIGVRLFVSASSAFHLPRRTAHCAVARLPIRCPSAAQQEPEDATYSARHRHPHHAP